MSFLNNVTVYAPGDPQRYRFMGGVGPICIDSDDGKKCYAHCFGYVAAKPHSCYGARCGDLSVLEFSDLLRQRNPKNHLPEKLGDLSTWFSYAIESEKAFIEKLSKIADGKHRIELNKFREAYAEQLVERIFWAREFLVELRSGEIILTNEKDGERLDELVFQLWNQVIVANFSRLCEVATLKLVYTDIDYDASDRRDEVIKEHYEDLCRTKGSMPEFAEINKLSVEFSHSKDEVLELGKEFLSILESFQGLGLHFAQLGKKQKLGRERAVEAVKIASLNKEAMACLRDILQMSSLLKLPLPRYGGWGNMPGYDLTRLQYPQLDYCRNTAKVIKDNEKALRFYLDKLGLSNSAAYSEKFIRRSFEMILFCFGDQDMRTFSTSLSDLGGRLFTYEVYYELFELYYRDFMRLTRGGADSFTFRSEYPIGWTNLSQGLLYSALLATDALLKLKRKIDIMQM